MRWLVSVALVLLGLFMFAMTALSIVGAFSLSAEVEALRANEHSEGNAKVVAGGAGFVLLFIFAPGTFFTGLLLTLGGYSFFPAKTAASRA